MTKIALGTVQFGINYGVANTTGRVSLDEVKSILELAKSKNITTLDTAIAYGDSEQVLGESGIEAFDIVTKLPAIASNLSASDIHRWVDEQVNNSLQKLKVGKVFAVLLHRPLQLLEKNGRQLFQSLQTLKQEGIVDKIGVSIYEPDDLEKICPKFDFDLIQLPLNIIDGRWDKWLTILYEQGVELHARSIFLQGLLLMTENRRPEKFNKWDTLWKEWDRWLKSNNLTPLEACLRYALSKKEITKVIVGVDSKKQLEEIISASTFHTSFTQQMIQINDSILLNPANWNNL